MTDVAWNMSQKLCQITAVMLWNQPYRATDTWFWRWCRSTMCVLNLWTRDTWNGTGDTGTDELPGGYWWWYMYVEVTFKIGWSDNILAKKQQAAILCSSSGIWTQHTIEDEECPNHGILKKELEALTLGVAKSLGTKWVNRNIYFFYQGKPINLH